MTQVQATIPARLQQFEERLRDIPRNESEQRTYLQDPQMKTGPGIANQLNDSIDRIEKGIQNVAVLFVTRLVSCSEDLERIQLDLEQAEGGLSAVRANAGRKLLKVAHPLASPKDSQPASIPRTLKLDLEFPSGAFDLNLGAYRGVGNRMDEEEQKTLIRRIEPGQNPPYSGQGRMISLPQTSAQISECLSLNSSELRRQQKRRSRGRHPGRRRQRRARRGGKGRIGGEARGRKAVRVKSGSKGERNSQKSVMTKTRRNKLAPVSQICGWLASKCRASLRLRNASPIGCQNGSKSFCVLE
jgi:hypothetical protein